ncbi:MAG: transketolase family protein [Endomicrobium sp.]|jgi:transketolase|nr:transketolase family protein [Endomicrobium sp.]
MEYFLKKETRFGFGDALVELGKQNDKLFVLGADTSTSVGLEKFSKLFPKRFINVGIAETNLVGIASGLAIAGFIPFIATYGIFASGRSWEGIRTNICYSNLNVKIGGSHSGITVGYDGATHQALEEIAIMRCIPRMTVICPCDYFETKKAVLESAELKGPVYIRYGRNNTPIITNKNSVFKIGKANILKNGKDVAIISCGIMVYESLVAASILKKQNISARVINIHTIKPIDEEVIIKAANDCGAIVTAEEHQIYGGLGSAVSEIITRKTLSIPIEMIGINDRFGESGSSDELLFKFKLKSKNIVEAVLLALNRKL